MKFLTDYEDKLTEVAKKEGLICLEDFEVLKFDGKNALAFLELISKTRLSLNTLGNIDLLTHDLINSISPDIKFSLANIYLYFPSANNFLKEIKHMNGQDVPTYNRTLSDRRFFYYINVAFEKLYNFWDRVGDTLAMAFKLEIPEKEIFFGGVIDKLCTLGIESEELQWLKKFKDSDYSTFLNRLRIKIVHYRQKDSYFFMEWVNSFTNTEPGNIELLVQLQKEKEELPVLLKEQFKLTNIGFEKMVKLIHFHGPYEK